MQKRFEMLQEMRQRFPQLDVEDEALSNVCADLFWLTGDRTDVQGDTPSDPLDDMRPFELKVVEILNFANQCYAERNVEGFQFCTSALARVRHFADTPGLMEEQCWMTRAALAHLTIMYGLLLADGHRWDASERCLAFARETAEKMDAAHRIEGVPKVVGGGLRWRTLLFACEMRCRVWLFGDQPSARPVYSAYEALGLMRSMPMGSNFSGSVQLAALQVAKYCLLTAKDIFPEALSELSVRCELDFSSKVGAWRQYDKLTLVDSQYRGKLDSYIFLDLELFKELESGACTEETLNRLWDLRDNSLEFYGAAGYELKTLRAVLEGERRAMLNLCHKAERLRDAQ